MSTGDALIGSRVTLVIRAPGRAGRNVSPR